MGKNNNCKCKTAFIFIAVALAFAGSILLYLKAYDETIMWQNVTLFCILAASSGIIPGVLAFLTSKFARNKKTIRSIIGAVICMAIAEGLIFGLLTVNNMMFSGKENKMFAGAAYVAIGIMTFVLCFLLIMKFIPRSGAKRVLAGILAVVILIAPSTVGLLAAVIPMLCSSSSAVGYTDGEPIIAQRRNYCYDNSSLLIGGYCWSDSDNNPELVKLAKKAGLDFLISNCTNETFLNACDSENLGIILSQPDSDTNSFFLPRMFQTVTEDSFAKWREFTSQDYKSNTLYSHKCIWGNSFVDEPFHPYFNGIADGVKNYYLNTDGKMPYVNQVPFSTAPNLGLEASMKIIRNLPLLNNIDNVNDTVERYKVFISDYINTVDTDYLCFDVYPLKAVYNKTSGKYVFNTNDMWLRNLDLLADACRKTNRDLWVITQASGEVDDQGKGTDSGARFTDTPEDIRWQYYVSLSFGAKALINSLYYSGWWERDSHMIDSNKKMTDTYRAVQTVNGEFETISQVYGKYSSLGAFLTNGKKAAGNKTNTLTVSDDAKRPSISSDSPILTGCFSSSAGSNAYTLVNMWEPGTEKTAKAEVKFDGANEITVYRMGKIETVSGDTLNINLESSEGIFVTVK